MKYVDRVWFYKHEFLEEQNSRVRLRSSFSIFSRISGVFFFGGGFVPRELLSFF